MESGQPGQLIAIVSARSDGATSLALGFAALLGARHRTVLVDVGRLRQSLPSALSTGSVLWVVAPRPLGLAAFERAYRAVEEVTHPTLNLQVVLNRLSQQSLADVATFVRSEYGLPVLGEV